MIPTRAKIIVLAVGSVSHHTPVIESGPYRSRPLKKDSKTAD